MITNELAGRQGHNSKSTVSLIRYCALSVSVEKTALICNLIKDLLYAMPLAQVHCYLPSCALMPSALRRSWAVATRLLERVACAFFMAHLQVCTQQLAQWCSIFSPTMFDGRIPKIYSVPATCHCICCRSLT